MSTLRSSPAKSCRLGQRRARAAPDWSCSAAFTPSGRADIKTRRSPICCRCKWIRSSGSASAIRFAPTCNCPGRCECVPAKPLGERHYLMQLGEGPDAAKLWDKLPALEGANRLGPPKPTAQVLAETPEGQPLLVVHDVGGRRDGVCRRHDMALVDGRLRAAAQAILAASGSVAGAQGRTGRWQRLGPSGRVGASSPASAWSSPPGPNRRKARRCAAPMHG